MIKIIQQLRSINWTYGKGDVSQIIIDMDDSRIEQGSIYGYAVRRFGGGMSPDQRMFKVEDGYVTFLSHRRKL
jgi:hypothetical protein